jgi:hypothetical protein
MVKTLNRKSLFVYIYGIPDPGATPSLRQSQYHWTSQLAETWGSHLQVTFFILK